MPRRHRPEHSILSRLDEADSLIERKQWIKARELLEDIDARSPNREDVLSRLLDVYAELDDMPPYQIVCERLLKTRPNHPDYMLALAGACLGNVRPASALIAFRRFLNRYPDHERAAEARQTLTGLESRIHEMFRDAGFTGEDALESASLHEESLALIDQGKYGQARNKAEELLKRHPDFVLALNNVGQAYFAEGQFDRAIEFAERALALDDDNFHALGNLTRYYCLKGKMDQAQSALERLKRVESKATDVWLKKMEAASTLGDDLGVLAAFQQAEHAGALKPPFAEPFLFHLAAVAQMRLGNEKQARGYWQKALDVTVLPNFSWSGRAASAAASSTLIAARRSTPRWASRFARCAPLGSPNGAAAVPIRQFVCSLRSRPPNGAADEVNMSFDYRRYYDLETFLFEDVSKHFRDHGSIGAFDFFSIVIWKANRSKSLTARRLRKCSKPGESLDALCHRLTAQVRAAQTPEARFMVLVGSPWKFGLPMASAILAVLYPETFTVYDYRVCEELQDFSDLKNKTNPAHLWAGYNRFLVAVQATSSEGNLRDKDRHLIGRSLAVQLNRDIKDWFAQRSSPPNQSLQPTRPAGARG